MTNRLGWRLTTVIGENPVHNHNNPGDGEGDDDADANDDDDQHHDDQVL